MPNEKTRHVVLYDGVCGLCSRLVQFILKRDRRDVFRFAALQSPFGIDVVRRANRNPDQLDTLYVVGNFQSSDEMLFWKGRAFIFILAQMGGAWSVLGMTLRLFPFSVLDFFYSLVARSRYRLFGRYDECPLPDKRHREKFIDL